MSKSLSAASSAADVVRARDFSLRRCIAARARGIDSLGSISELSEIRPSSGGVLRSCEIGRRILDKELVYFKKDLSDSTYPASGCPASLHVSPATLVACAAFGGIVALDWARCGASCSIIAADFDRRVLGGWGLAVRLSDCFGLLVVARGSCSVHVSKYMWQICAKHPRR